MNTRQVQIIVGLLLLTGLGTGAGWWFNRQHAGLASKLAEKPADLSPSVSDASSNLEIDVPSPAMFADAASHLAVGRRIMVRNAVFTGVQEAAGTLGFGIGVFDIEGGYLDVKAWVSELQERFEGVAATELAIRAIEGGAGSQTSRVAVKIKFVTAPRVPKQQP